MATRPEPQFTASIVISSEHAGLRPHFKDLEHELYRALACCRDSREAKHYLIHIRHVSREWREIMAAADLEK
jgi:hypothetical protein